MVEEEKELATLTEEESDEVEGQVEEK